MAGYSENFSKKSRLEKEDIKQRPKKFVFLVYPENIDYVESLEYQEKQELINQLIADYRQNEHHNYKAEQDLRKFKKIIFTALAIIVGIPLLLFLINVSLDATKTNYLDMQRKFEQLY